MMVLNSLVVYADSSAMPEPIFSLFALLLVGCALIVDFRELLASHELAVAVFQASSLRVLSACVSPYLTTST